MCVTVHNEGFKAPFVLSEEVKPVSRKERSLIFEQVDRSVGELLIGNTGNVSKTAASTVAASLESFFLSPSSIHVHPLAF